MVSNSPITRLQWTKIDDRNPLQIANLATICRSIHHPPEPDVVPATFYAIEAPMTQTSIRLAFDEDNALQHACTSNDFHAILKSANEFGKFINLANKYSLKNPN